MEISVQAEIEKRLMQALNPIKFLVIDDSKKHKGHLESSAAEGTHFRIQIVSALFNSVSRIERHKIVYKILDDLLKNQIHALSLTLISDNEFYADKF